MIRLDSTDGNRPLTLPAACQWLGERTGKVPATSTMWRWTLRGVRGGVRLESFRIGGTTYTTPAMIRRFIERTSQAAGVVVDVSPDGIQVTTAAGAESAGDRRREQIAAAQQRLKEICAPRRRARASHTDGTVPVGGGNARRQ